MTLIKEEKGKKYYKNNSKTELIIFVTSDNDSLRRDFSYYFFRYLEHNGIKTNLLRNDVKYKDNGLITHKYQPINIDISIQNSAVAEYAKKLFSEGTELDTPIVDWYLDNGGKKIRINPELAIELNKYTTNDKLAHNLISNKTEIQQINKLALKINTLLKKFLLAEGWILDQFYFSVGLVNNHLAVVDEISPQFAILSDNRGHLFDQDIFKRKKSRSEMVTQYKQLIAALKTKI
ncbi:hypothetical protein COT97_04490 [Candidatus Falkowbacteria bacterium CG10_big_fil_rev_8_21_14_0_10_39_11]|uniref:SAICAR synthetase/ADE2 N-terminal domain-containing protein n=1 Tax=Candidatus Falkowbacteria bacterium CG10_big_fil_rev_8_21_14_0_10_39_11 TaxID=1974565 RepID=A0A2H0V3W8_9BACT|nr:MAG: hypothetical protein COT97_04490 [Candidatus Falkowbacteria bacterium CG10_big_fil_rev_8_21_14_0_10_39_11]